MSAAKSSHVKTAAKFVLSFGLIYWLITSRHFDPKALEALLVWPIIVGCLVLTGINTLCANERWLRLMRARGLPTTRIQALKLYMVGAFFNFVVPGGVGGDLVKGFYIASENPQARLDSVVSVAMDRLVGLYTMVVMALLAMLAEWDLVHSKPELTYIFYFIVLLTLGFSGFWTVIFSRRLSAWNGWNGILSKLPKTEHFTRMFHAFCSYSNHKSLFFSAVGFSFLSQVLSILMFILIGYVIGANVPLAVYFFVVPVGFMVTAVPISPGGIGVGQAAFYYLFNIALHESSSLGLVTITALQAAQLTFGLSGAWFYLTMKKSMHQHTMQA